MLSMDMVGANQPPCRLFIQFSILPKEIRNQIWKLSLPPPRLIEVYPDFFSSMISRWPALSKHGAWVTSSDPVEIPLLQVNREARNTALESYQKVLLCNGKHILHTSFYLDLKRDTILFTKKAFELLLQPRLSFAADDRSAWIYRVHNIGIPVKDHGPWWTSQPTPFHHFLLPRNDVASLRQISELCYWFPKVRRLYFIIDGRNWEFKGSEELAEATEEFEDMNNFQARRKALEWVVMAQSWLIKQYPEMRIPEMGLRLLINGRRSPKFQRYWIYQEGNCSVMTRQPPKNNGYDSLEDLDGLFGEIGDIEDGIS